MSSYKALYRKYRPQTFSEVVGQSHIVKTLRNEISLNHIFHAYLFTGPRGTGKTSIARIFAKSINCLNSINGESCEACDLCKSITDGSNPDIIEIDAASQTRVDNIREIIDRVPYLPTMSKYKVYIIDEVHMLSQNSFNALLKTLEEPPSHAIFILCTTEVEKVIPTIISRCQKFDFHLIDKEEIEERLNKVVDEEGLSIEKEAISLIAENAQGGMRDALSILDQVSSLSLDSSITKDDVLEVTGKLSVDALNSIALSIKDNNSTDAISKLDKLMSLGKEAEKITSSLISYFKDILVIKNTSKSINKVGYETSEFEEVKSNLNNQKLFKYIEVLSDTMKNIKLSLDKKMYLELALIKMCDKEAELVKVQPSIKEESKVQSGYNPNIKYEAPSFMKPKEEPVKEEVKEAPITETKKEEPIFEDASNIFNEEKEEQHSIFDLFSDNIKKEDSVQVIEESIPEKATLVNEVKEEAKDVVDNPSDYDIEFVESVLNRADKSFKEELINKLQSVTKETKGTSYYKYACLLDGVEVVASSREKVILSFEEIGHCNLMMKIDNYKGVKSIFKDYLDYQLDYISLPKSLWIELSNDFIVKYKGGAKIGTIKLNKVPCPGLKAIISSDPKEEDKFLGIEELFGDKLTFKK